MSSPTFAEYAAAGFNRVPVARQVIADLETPLSAYLKLAAGRYSYLFESVQGGERWGRYSIIGLAACEVLRIKDKQLHRFGAEVDERLSLEDPVAYVEQYRQRYRAPEVPGLPRFNGGLVGYFGYDSVRYFEPKLCNPPAGDTLDVPDIVLMRSEEVVVFDNLRGSLYLIVLVDPTDAAAIARAEKRLDALEQKLRAPLPQPTPQTGPRLAEEDFRSEMPQAQYEAGVERIREYTLSGDVMQVVPAQRMIAPYEGDPLDVYRALRYLNPSPYMFYLNLDDFHIAGSSPEILARLEQGRVTVRPIAGTRRRGQTPEEDAVLEADLLADPKEIAEHLMLIDLGRNDVGRVAKSGTVQLTEKMKIERYSHVMHIVSQVDGELADNLGPLDVLKATFPAGTLSGAPKIRAMEIIDELEPVRRGVYGGAVGYIGFNGEMDTAIAIRTGVIKDGKIFVQAGAGVVADSVPVKEWEETLNKARAVFTAVNMVNGGLSPEVL